MKPKPPVFLICAPADAARIVPRSIFGKFCVKCGQELMVAPSGQSLLQRHPDAIILCGSCWMKKVKADDIIQVETAADTDTIKNEVRTSLANPRHLRRHRN